MKRYLKWRSISILSVFALFVCLAPFALAQETPAPEATKAQPEEKAEEKAPAPEAAPAEAPPPEASEAEPPPPPPAPAPAPAEEEAAAPSETKEPVEEIVVTGSRIRTSPMDTPAPILKLSAEDIQRTGLVSIADILQRLPSSGGSLNAKFNSSGNFGFPADGGGIGAGAAQVDLRYLGSKRVLVLVDGIRWVGGSSASGVATATDLNTIPVSMIERIEVLEDGASAIYGSDAIAGVVNIITKKEFQGMSASAQMGGYHHMDGLTQQYDLTWGSRSERLSMILGLSYMGQASVSAADREMSKVVTPGYEECTWNCSSGTPQGRFMFTDPNTGQELNLTINDLVGGIPVYDPTDPGGPNDDFHPFETVDRFNYSPFNYVLSPIERFGAFSLLKYEFTPNVSLNTKVLYNNRKSKNRAAPEPIFFGGWAGNGNRMDRIAIDATNPYNPFGFTISPENTFIARRPLEAGPRRYEQTVNTYYISGGLEGNFGLAGRNFYWDATAVYSVNRADQIKRGGFNSAKLEKALGPLDVCQADPECVPFNLFGGQGADGLGTITQEMLDYVTFVQKDVSQQELFDFNANLTGGLLSLPGGDLGLAAGFEFRNLNGFFRPDSMVTAGDTAGVPSTPTSGGYYVAEGYAELLIPLVKEVPGLHQLDVTGAIRMSDYSTFGAQETLKIGMRWRPFEDLMLRGNFTQGFRAPGIGELYGSDARYDQEMTDPCSDMLNPEKNNPQSLIDNCVALGVPADGSYEQLNPQISLISGGNRDLQPESSSGWIASMVYSPSWVEYTDWADDFDLEVAYYWIEVDNAIQPRDAEIQLQMCVDTLDPVFCDDISRTTSGVINRYNNRLTNIGSMQTDGLDITLTYTSPQTFAGVFRVISLSNILLNFVEKVPSSEGFDEISLEGTEMGDPEKAFPKFKSTLILGWALGEWSASMTGRYIHSIKETCNADLAADYPDTCSNNNAGTNAMDPTFYLDMQLTWLPKALDDRLFITLGVNNVFNQDPPVCYTCALNGFDATTYDIPGVYGYLRCGYTM